MLCGVYNKRTLLQRKGNYSRLCKNCRKLFGKCGICEELEYIPHFRIYDDINYCACCADSYLRLCHRCNNYVLASDTSLDGFGYICNECDVQPRVRDYSYRPNPIFMLGSYEKQLPENLYFGVELEVEFPPNNFETSSWGSIAEYTLGLLPSFVYAKTDSSVEKGFEIVSHPMTYKWLKENIKDWEKILDLRHKGYISYNTKTCGMHIHLSKTAFGSFHLYKFMKFFYENVAFVLKISQRDSKREIKRWASFDNVDDATVLYKAKYKRGGPERHVAVNINSEDTVEVRIFKGTLNPISFWKNIEFCKCVYDFTKDHSNKCINVDTFKDYIKSHRNTFPNLYNFLFKRGCVTLSKVEG